MSSYIGTKISKIEGTLTNFGFPVKFCFCDNSLEGFSSTYHLMGDSGGLYVGQTKSTEGKQREMQRIRIWKPE